MIQVFTGMSAPRYSKYSWLGDAVSVCWSEGRPLVCLDDEVLDDCFIEETKRYCKYRGSFELKSTNLYYSPSVSSIKIRSIPDSLGALLSFPNRVIGIDLSERLSVYNDLAALSQLRRIDEFFNKYNKDLEKMFDAMVAAGITVGPRSTYIEQKYMHFKVESTISSAIIYVLSLAATENIVNGKKLYLKFWGK